MKRFTLATTIIVIGATLTGIVSGAELRIRSDARPQGGVVRLGDVADVFAAGDAEVHALAAIELAPAPTPGKQRTMAVREIQDMLERRGLNMLQHRFSGANQVIIAGYAEPATKPIVRSRTLPLSAMQEARRAVVTSIERTLQQSTASDEPWIVDVDLTDAQAQVVLANVHHVEARGGQAPWTGRQQYEVEVRGDKGPTVINITAQIGIPSAIVVTTKAVPRGSILRESDVMLERAKPGTPIGDAFQAIDEVVGREAVLAIAPGQVLSPQYIRTPLLVKRGSVVTVHVVAPGVKIRTTGRVREDGSRGESVTIESLLDRKPYLARVTGIDQVEVTADAATLPTEPVRSTAESRAIARRPASSTRWTGVKQVRAEETDLRTK